MGKIGFLDWSGTTNHCFDFLLKLPHHSWVLDELGYCPLYG